MTCRTSLERPWEEPLGVWGVGVAYAPCPVFEQVVLSTKIPGFVVGLPLLPLLLLPPPLLLLRPQTPTPLLLYCAAAYQLQVRLGEEGVGVADWLVAVPCLYAQQTGVCIVLEAPFLPSHILHLGGPASSHLRRCHCLRIFLAFEGGLH